MQSTQTWSTHRCRALIGEEHSQTWSTHRCRAFTDTEHSQAWSTHRSRALTGIQHSQAWSTHRCKAPIPWSIHRCRALTGKEHLWPQSVEHSDHVCGTLPHTVSHEPFINSTTPRVSSTPLCGCGNCVLQPSIVPITSQSRRLHVVHTQEGDFPKVLNCGGHLANIQWMST